MEVPYIIQWAKDMSTNAKTGADAYNYHQLADQLEAVIREEKRKAKLKAQKAEIGG
jgi:hypothetical protein